MKRAISGVIFGAAIVIILLLVIGMLNANSQARHAIHTGGEGGAYYSVFCPPLPDALNGAYFYGYECTPSKGTVDNIDKVLANPTDIGFAQLDVYAQLAKQRPDDFARLTVVRELACEGLWMVTTNEQIDDYGKVLGLARRIPFVLPPDGSGAAATFESIMSIDQDGLGRARNVDHAASVDDMLNIVATGDYGEVGFFVQFADPQNANIKAIVENDLTVLPVVSREMRSQEVDGHRLYKLSEFELESGWLSGQSLKTTCTPAVIFTGNPSAFADPADTADQEDLIAALTEVPADDLLPKEGRLAKLIKATKQLGDKAWDEMVAAAEAAKQAIQDQ